MKRGGSTFRGVVRKGRFAEIMFQTAENLPAKAKRWGMASQAEGAKAIRGNILRV